MKKLKPKNIHLSEGCIKQLSKDAIDGCLQKPTLMVEIGGKLIPEDFIINIH